MECEICGEMNAKDRGEKFGVLCDDCFDEQYEAVHLDDGEDEE